MNSSKIAHPKKGLMLKTCLLEVESNRIEQILNWFLSNFSNYFSPSNQLNHKFSNRIERISNEYSIWKIWLYPILRVELNEFHINFHRTFRIFFALSNQSNRKFSNRTERILNKFQFDSTPNVFLVSNPKRFNHARKLLGLIQHFGWSRSLSQEIL